MRDELFIVGKGPSLRGFDYSLLKDKYTLGLNSAIFKIPNPDIVLFIDKSFYRQNKKYVDDFKGEVIAAKTSTYHSPIPEIERDYTRMAGILAVHYGLYRAKKVYLLGYDLKTTEEYPYAEDCYGLQDREKFEKFDGSYRLYYDQGSWINVRTEAFDKLFSGYKDRVFNCNPKSGVTTFDYKKLEDVL